MFPTCRCGVKVATSSGIMDPDQAGCKGVACKVLGFLSWTNQRQQRQQEVVCTACSLRSPLLSFQCRVLELATKLDFTDLPKS